MKKIGLKYKAILMLLLITTASFKSSSNKTEISLPTPEGIDNMLFYVQRTINANTIVYELNINKDGVINESEPIKAYWIKYTQGGKIDPLTFIQRKYAYGVKAKLIDKEKKTFSFEFVSYNKRQFYLSKSSVDNKYRVYGFVNNKLSVLNNICVKIEGGSFWLPNVKSVEVKAKDPNTLAENIEIIKP